MALLDDVKLTLRINNSAYDGEVTDLILAAEADLGLTGILDANITDTDPLIKRAVITYCKAHFGLENADSQKYLMAYEAIRNHLSLSADYAPLEEGGV